MARTKAVASPMSPRKLENEFARTLEYMVKEIAERFENGTLKKLNKKTINKFADAQVGNYAVVFLTFKKQVERKIKKQFSDDKIKQYVQDMFKKANEHNQISFYSALAAKVGLPMDNFVQRENLTTSLNALELETRMWLEEMRDDTISYFTNRMLRQMAEGSSMEQLLKEHHANTKNRKGHARFVAKQQLMTHNSLSTKLRAQSVGIEEAIWRTSRDSKVRASHIDRNKKRFRLDEGLFSWVDGKHLLPAMDYNCRCRYDMIIEGLNL